VSVTVLGLDGASLVRSPTVQGAGSGHSRSHSTECLLVLTEGGSGAICGRRASALAA
jgi:hypothetical protein